MAQPASYREAHPEWREASTDPGVGPGRRFPFLVAADDGHSRPLVFVRVANGSLPAAAAVVPAIVDTGAHVSLASRRLAERIGIAFEKGSPCQSATGIGGSGGRAFAHEVHLAVLAPGPEPGKADVAFGPMIVPFRFIEGDLPFLLLGQLDFLSRFTFTQAPQRGYFHLQWLVG